MAREKCPAIPTIQLGNSILRNMLLRGDERKPYNNTETTRQSFMNKRTLDDLDDNQTQTRRMLGIVETLCTTRLRNCSKTYQT